MMTPLSRFLVLAAAVGAGCGTDHPVTTFVGPTSDPSIFLALSTDDAKTAAYLCDGDPSAGQPDKAPGVSVWFTGAASGELDLATNSTAVHATIEADVASGTVTLAGTTLTFDIPAEASTDAGLFIADETVNGSRVLGGWIVLADGEQRGAVGFDGGGGIGTVIGPLLAPASRAIIVSGIGALRVAPFDPKGFDGGGGIGRTPGM
jgi:hypothetical protein